jgi:thioredoxin-dependent peroxiredoxin
MKGFTILLSAAVLGAGVLASVAARPVDDGLKVGDMAPDFTLPGSDGKTHSLSGLKGKHVVLAWFPKAFTGG